MSKIKLFIISPLAVLCLLIPIFSFAGGPIIVDGNSGLPYRWDTPIPLHPENGVCGPLSSNQVIEKIDNIMQQWQDGDFFNLQYEIISGSLGQVDIDETNYQNFFAPDSNSQAARDGKNPIFFDDTGEIIDDYFGNGSHNSVLGFAGPDNFNIVDGVPFITDGQALFNCRCLEGNQLGNCNNGFSFPESNLDFVILHEMGHFLGLDHSDLGLNNLFPAMYPSLENAEQQVELMYDDIVAISSLYALDVVQNTSGTLIGTIVNSSGAELRCLNVIASTDDPEDTLTTVTGYYATYQDLNQNSDSSDAGECIDNCGFFRLTGLDLNKTYTITIESLDSGWIQGSAIGPCLSRQPQIGDSRIAGFINFEGDSTPVNAGILELQGGQVSPRDPSTLDDSQNSGSSGGGCHLSTANSAISVSVFIFSILPFFMMSLIQGIYRRRDRE